MKMVLTISDIALRNDGYRHELARTIAKLLGDAHKVAIVQGIAEDSDGSARPWTDQDGSNRFKVAGAALNQSEFEAIAKTGRLLAANLGSLNICGLAIAASDAGICQVRRKVCNGTNGNERAEICGVEPRWIDIICMNSGVPIISNTVLSPWGQSYLVDFNQFATLCSIRWNADSLTHLILENGVTDSKGGLIRWLNVKNIDSMVPGLKSESMFGRLKMCKQALEGGVHRVRILPLERIQDLAHIYFSKIEHGTEVILMSEAIRNTRSAITS